jgi:Fic family protein
MLLFEHLPGATVDDTPAVVEVANNYRVLEAACGQAGRSPLSAADIRRMHEMLFEGVDEKGGRAGEYRMIPNFIGNGPRIEDARYVPPPPGDVPGCMDELIRFINAPGDLPTVVRCAMAHYQFEAIHPFFDGNGRIGRALVLSMLSQEGVLPVPLINPSAELERQRRAYYDCLLDVTQRGDWATWIEFFAGCVEREADDACRRLARLDALRDQYRGQFAAARASALLLRLIDELFADPAVTARDASDRLGISANNAQRLVDKLVAGGMLQEVTGQKRNRVYMAQAIIDVFATPAGERQTRPVPPTQGE